MRRRRAIVGIASVAALVAASPGVATAATVNSAANGPAVVHVGPIDREDIAPSGASEPHTVVEPDIAADPANPLVAVAVAHDGRYADGGAVDITYTWTHDGGRTWQHHPVPYLTKAVGGAWDRASDPVLAWGPDGSVYLSALVIQATTCDTGVAVLRSTDGGQTWHRPVMADLRHSCTFSDDKNWIAVDNSPFSPFFGRVYQFWTPFLFKANGHYIGSPQAVRWSDDHGATWSGTHFVTPRRSSTQNSQPMLQPDGTIVDAYMNYGPGQAGDEPESPVVAARLGDADRSAAPAPAQAGVGLAVRTSTDGGATWSSPTTITSDVGGPFNVRCCLPSATADPRTGELYATWISAGTGEPVMVSRSSNGTTWSTPLIVSTDAVTDTMTHVNSDVTALGGKAFVSYGTRDRAVAGGRYVQQELVSSYDAGQTFGPAIALGPRSDLHWAARAPVAFPGDYMGTSLSGSRLYVAWARSFRPPRHSGNYSQYNQLLWGAVLLS